MTADNIQRKSVSGSVIGLIAIAIAVVAIAVFVALNPEILKNLMYLALIILAALIVVAVVVAIAMFVLAIPFYAAKGEVHQTHANYDINDVKAVKEKNLDDEKKN